jgi:hypothetical protein
MSKDKWVILFSEEVGQEHWKGTPPPLASWEWFAGLQTYILP